MNALFAIISATLLCACTSVSGIAEQHRISQNKFSAALLAESENTSPRAILYTTDPESHTFDPEIGRAKEKAPTALGKFHGYPILGASNLDHDESRKLLLELKSGVDTQNDPPAKCFMPRHGLRIITDDGAIDYVICFECRRFEKYQNDKAINPDGCTSRNPAAEFNRVAKLHNLPIAK